MVYRKLWFLHIPHLKQVMMNQNDKKTYEEAIHLLNKVQSNRNNLVATKNQIISNSHSSKQKLELVEKYLVRSGINHDALNKLPVIHVSGTKGKGSTCAFCESILRHNGYKTGFFSSPHLIEVRERIMINGRPISKRTFSKYFWNVMDKLDSHKENEEDLPFYFQLLFIMAVHVFLKENVDVAIIEVGIGGEYDPTNIVTNVPVAGITSLGFDHTSVLGKTIESIAWNKAGIMKKGSKVFTVPQPEGAYDVLHRRSIERECFLEVVRNECCLSCIQKYPASIQTNINLAIKIAEEWLISRPKQNNSFLDVEILKKSIQDCKWPGRYEIQQKGNLSFYIDGAHTVESIEICMKWYLNEIKDKEGAKGLIFNLTGGRSCEKFFAILMKCHFKHVIFVPNIAESSIEKADNINLVLPVGEQLDLCHKYEEKWLNNSSRDEDVQVFPSVKEAIDYLHQKGRCHVLVTGSLHLVGAALSLLNPDLNGNLNGIS
ncbi:folylpolyglutamate synthase, mitochondrial-like isoform X2 [Coccinella septempunctata]|uniref:folylpolyglutamate synthase, mitochondrial-like isoform X2 n=1 Tax=Coccinella septempunctata TaxID=41139 RepID=UPI001D07F2D8|nr:folylpolyglutamate synthase, mitochondrial-like isoform X2 [Coccinella septempunctata]